MHFEGDMVTDLDGQKMEERMWARWDKRIGVTEHHEQ